MTEYFLMNKDKFILPFTSEKDAADDFYFEQTEEECGLLPYGFTDIESFVKSRRAPKNRKHIIQLLTETGCDDYDTFLQITMGLSLNDTFWIKAAHSDVSWEDVSLYRNSFNDVIANVAFRGGEVSISSSSPEYTTDGTYAKCWKRDEAGIYLLKSNSDSGKEVFSEYYASQISALLCHSAVEYTLEGFHGQTVCRCPIFTDEKQGFLPAIKVLSASGHKKAAYLLEFYSRMGMEDDLRRMIVLDALILNTDRHAGNYGFLIDNESQKISSTAPVFDHNRSLLFDVDVYDNSYLKQIVPRIGNDFNVSANYMLNDSIRADLLNLKGFQFKRSPIQDDLSDARIHLLEEIIDGQIDHILNRKQLSFCRF